MSRKYATRERGTIRFVSFTSRKPIETDPSRSRRSPPRFIRGTWHPILMESPMPQLHPHLVPIFDEIVRRNPGEPEFRQAAQEVLESLGPVV